MENDTQHNKNIHMIKEMKELKYKLGLSWAKLKLSYKFRDEFQFGMGINFEVVF